VSAIPASFVPERIQPVAEARLAASDLRDLVRLADHHRRRHVRAVHDTWGIATGLRLEDRAEGEAGDGPVVRPGVAFDRCGRLLVLAASAPLPVAAQLPGERLWIAVLRADLAAGEPAATLRWAAPGDPVEAGLDVVLGTVAAIGGRVAWTDVGRRYVRTAAPVALAAGFVRRGTAVAAGTPQQWTATIAVDEGFAGVPMYVAGVSPGDPGSGTATVQILEAAADGFRITVRRPTRRDAEPGGVAAGTSAITTTPEDVAWIAALPQAPAGAGDPIPASGPCPGLLSNREHR
jgi:hypothetical protein